MNITKRAWTIYRAAEVKAGRKFTSADRKGKGSEWAKAMRKAYSDSMMERRIAAAMNLLKPEPKYNQFSLNPSERSEQQRRARDAARNHNDIVLAAAIEKPLNQKEAAEAKALGLTARDYNNAAKWAKVHSVTVTGWIGRLKAAEAAAEEKEEQQILDHISAVNKIKVAAIHNRFNRR